MGRDSKNRISLRWGGGAAVGREGGPPHPPAVPLSGHNAPRVVMGLTVLAAAARLPVCIEGAEAVDKSWPDFFAAVRQLGVEVELYA